VVESLVAATPNVRGIDFKYIRPSEKQRKKRYVPNFLGA